MSFDAVGGTASFTDPNWNVITQAYDSLNRVSVEDNKNSRVTSAYDALGRLSGRAMTWASVITIEPGRTETVTEFRQTRSYTGSGMVEAKVDQVLVSGTWQTVGTATNAYDAADRLTGIVGATAAGTVRNEAYSYDDANRLTGRTGSGGTRTMRSIS